MAQWYSFWKAWFPSAIAELPGVIQGFRRGLDLINLAVELGGNRSSLPKPNTEPMSRTHFDAAQKVQIKAQKPTLPEEVSFKALVEEAAEEVDLLVQPLNRSEPSSGAALYRISKGIDGKGGANFYIAQDVLWLEERLSDTGKSRYVPVGMQELFQKAK